MAFGSSQGLQRVGPHPYAGSSKATQRPPQGLLPASHPASTIGLASSGAAPPPTSLPASSLASIRPEPDSPLASMTAVASDAPASATNWMSSLPTRALHARARTIAPKAAPAHRA